MHHYRRAHDGITRWLYRCGAVSHLVPLLVSFDAVVTIRRLLGRPAPPGAPGGKPLAGELTEIDLYGMEQRRLLIEHPRCAYCAGV